MANVDVKSEITGVVCKVVVAVGDAVGEFDPIVLVESMKMEIPVAAPKAGRITAIHVREGDMIAEGDSAATLST
jgi:biotin carboxyl carrier protein